MEAKELRRGNWVNRINSSGALELIEVETIGEDGINFYYLSGEDNSCSIEYMATFKDIKPIPLTEDWYERIEHNNWHGDFGDLYIWKIDIANEYNFTTQRLPIIKYYIVINNGLGDAESYGVRLEIKTVHQAQNIWYYITEGQELTIHEKE